jgi:hypothetical protein
MPDQRDREAIVHLKQAARIIALGRSPHLASRREAIVQQLETNGSAQDDYAARRIPGTRAEA